MNIFKVISFGIIATCLILVVKNQREEIALLCVLASSVIILIFVFDDIKSIIELITRIVEASSINKDYIKIILKIIGIAYIVEFGKDICKDAGQTSIASKIEMAGKLTILVISMPVITSLLEIVSELIWNIKKEV